MEKRKAPQSNQIDVRIAQGSRTQGCPSVCPSVPVVLDEPFYTISAKKGSAKELAAFYKCMYW